MIVRHIAKPKLEVSHALQHSSSSHKKPGNQVTNNMNKYTNKKITKPTQHLAKVIEYKTSFHSK